MSEKMFERSRSHLILIAVGTILSLFSLGSIVAFTEPNSASWITFTLLYLSIFLTTVGLFAFTGLFIREKYSNDLYAKNIRASTRQAFLLGILTTASLALNAHNLLFWWVVLTLVLFLIVIETFYNLQ
ncbi:MAG: hypothetical protein IT410_01290 [Candidatus Doudnabacteria bacterium]|nr:hypothetical protein [Candidatus Doudnabacteria bacterium]